VNKHESRAREIVQRLLYLTVATASGQGQPWNSPVYAAYDEHSNFYWSSSPEAQHSRNIRENDKVFLVIYDSTVPEGKGEAVYVEATAAALEDPAEIGQAKLGLARRASKPINSETDRLLAIGAQCIYRARSKRAWTNSFESDDKGRYVRDIRIEIPVDCLKGLVTW